jgi:hypothetical protein
MFRWTTLGFLVIAGCEPVEGVDCDAMAAASVGVTVHDAAGAPIEATVTFDAGDGPQACDSFEAGVFVCGFEVDGDITIHVEADGFADHEEVVHVDKDECHVIEEFLTIVLEPVEVDCTDVVVPAVRATVVGSGGEELSDVKVEWGDPRADMAPQPCELEGEGNWRCADERAGDIEIYASAAGHQTELQTVTIAMDDDGCHVVTQSLAFELEWLPD